MADKRSMLIDALEPEACSHHLDLVDVEIAGTRRNPILRVFLDTEAGGINLDELAAAQEWVDALVEEMDPFQDSYTLEVSSPGIDRPLRKPEDFQKYAGEDVVITYKNGGHGKATGVLQGIDDDVVSVKAADDEVLHVSLSDISRAHIIGKIDFSGHKKQSEKSSTTE